jgi:hypothetical protein
MRFFSSCSYLEMTVIEDNFVLLLTDCATGYKITIATVLKAAAGITTVAKSATNGPGNTTINNADPKNTAPEINVPTAVKTATLIIEFRNLPNIKNNEKNSKDVTGLSMIFGSWPPGKPVVKADIPPVTIAKSITLLISGKRIIPKNIIVNIMSGFIPRKMGGITACKTAPIPTNSDKDTRFFVFISQLSSA